MYLNSSSMRQRFISRLCPSDVSRKSFPFVDDSAVVQRRVEIDNLKKFRSF